MKILKFKLSLLVIGISSMINTLGQKPAIELTFTAVNDSDYMQLDSIKVMNRTQGVDTVLYWPDTVLSIYFMSIPESGKKTNEFKVFKNFPNPVKDQTIFSIYIPEKDNASIFISDVLGSTLAKKDLMLDQGFHEFRFIPGKGNLFFVTVIYRGKSSTIKIVKFECGLNDRNLLEYLGNGTTKKILKSMDDANEFVINPEDQLLYIGYIGTLESGILNFPENSDTIIFQFATNIPCPGLEDVTYEGQVYHTIQIFSQCWMKENLNVGWMIPGIGNMSDNGFIEKYCYNDDEDSCAKYGGLYQWDEIMQYNDQEGAKGICPTGWHIPTNEEWKVLEGAVDSFYGIGAYEWDIYWDWQGIDVGINLKRIDGWLWHPGTNGVDLFDFSALPAGGRGNNGIGGLGMHTNLWSSTENENYNAWARTLVFDETKISCHPDNGIKDFGNSVRCLLDY